MKPIETARIAVAVCNISLGRGSAKFLPLTVDITQNVLEQLRAQCRQKNVVLDVVVTDLTNPLDEMIKERVLGSLAKAEEQLAEAALPARFHSKLARVREAITGESFDGLKADCRLEELTYDLLDELSEPMFLRVDFDRRTLYEQKEPPFGVGVDVAFPAAQRDIAAAARCLALDEWTACVFHVMRCLELGLHALAAKVELPPGAMALENWKNVIDQIEKRIREMEALPKGPHKSEALQRFSAAAVQFRYFKDAWRNHVAHSRATYDERDAFSVFNHAKEFMEHLAGIA